MSSALHNASEISKKAVDGAQKGAKALSEKKKSDDYQRRMKKYNPIFPDDYTSEKFNIPNMIRIVDDAVRRGIDVCEGAIGWISMEKELEVLHLYDEAVDMSGIKFVPNIECNAIYYVDNFDRKKYVKVECIFGRAHDERLAELKHIAHSLGAKSCSVEISEGDSENSDSSMGVSSKAKYKGASLGVSHNSTHSQGKSEYRRGKVVAEFEGSDTPVKPTLKWFAHDDNINRLIEMRCTSTNSIKSEVLELEGSASATMSQKTASSIDFALGKIGMKTSLNMEKHANKEHHSKLIYIVEF